MFRRPTFQTSAGVPGVLTDVARVFPQSILTKAEIILKHLTNLLTSTLVGFAAGRSTQIQVSFLVNLEVPDEGFAEQFVLHFALSDMGWE
jgi:hypothetical protein